jgi:hypothetical protein
MATNTVSRHIQAPHDKQVLHSLFLRTVNLKDARPIGTTKYCQIASAINLNWLL